MSACIRTRPLACHSIFNYPASSLDFCAAFGSVTADAAGHAMNSHLPTPEPTPSRVQRNTCAAGSKHTHSRRAPVARCGNIQNRCIDRPACAGAHTARGAHTCCGYASQHVGLWCSCGAPFHTRSILGEMFSHTA